MVPSPKAESAGLAHHVPKYQVLGLLELDRFTDSTNAAMVPRPLLVATLLVAPVACLRAPVATPRSMSRSVVTVLRPRVVPRMAEEERSNPLAELPLPSIYAMAYAGITLLTIKDLSVNPIVTAWIDNGAQLADFPLQSFSGGMILVSFALFNLAKFAGVGKEDYYDDLEGLDVGSLSSQAAKWALAAEVPTRSADGAYEVATFAGGCFCTTPPRRPAPLHRPAARRDAHDAASLGTHQRIHRASHQGGTELHYQRLPGVVATCVGYTQGRTERPSYGEVCGGTTGHTEGIQMIFDPEVITYDALCDKVCAVTVLQACTRMARGAHRRRAAVCVA
eukprot:5664572-Prymnesium_polylepis.1